MSEDIELVKRFKKRDIHAFDDIFSKYYKPVYYFIYKMIYNKTAADDIAQDTFLKVFKSLKDTNEQVKLSTWIYRIAHNTCIDYMRKNRTSLEMIDNVDYEDTPLHDPETCFLNAETKDRIKNVMHRINSRYRMILILRDYNDLSYREIADVLKLSESCVKSLIYRARQEFQRLYGEVE